MASEWIKWTKGLTRKPEVVALSLRLKRNRFDVTARLMCVWEWADEVTSDGIVPGVTVEFIDELAGIDGFAEAMSDVGWLSLTADGVEFMNYVTHNGPTGKSRAQAQKRMGALRKRCAPSVTKTSPEKRREDRQTDDGAPPFPAFDLFDRLCKRKLTTSEQGRIHTWLDSLGDHDAGLVCQCVQHATENIASTPQTVRGAINYVAAIYERCLREGCGPGDFAADERKPSGRESELDAKRKLARKLAVEAYANDPA